MKFIVTRASSWHDDEQPCVGSTILAEKTEVFRTPDALIDAGELDDINEEHHAVYGVEINSLHELTAFISEVGGKVIITDYCFSSDSDYFKDVELPKYEICIYDDYVE